MPTRRTATLAGGAAAVGGAAVLVLADPHRRTRLGRSLRVWRLTARRGVDLAGHRVRTLTVDEQRRAELDAQYALRSAEDVAAVMGEMKGALMKVGQMLAFVLESLPDEAQQALAVLHADAPPMAPSLAAQVVRDELGDDPEQLFRSWDPVPVAAASVGQVHRAVLADGRRVAVKVQYPGVDRAILADLDNAEVLYGLVSSFTLKGLDVRSVVDELRARMGEELDYRLEAANQAFFADAYRDHPFIHVPEVVPERSARRVLTSEWVDGRTWAEFVAGSDDAARQRAGEIIWRFAQGSIHRLGRFNGDPHPGNYRFRDDGRVSFLDYGLVKQWAPDEWERLSPSLDAILARDPASLVEAMVASGFLPAGHGLDPAKVFAYVSAPYEPYLVEQFTFTRRWMAATIARIADVKGPLEPVVRTLDLPASFVILDRVVWGVSALLGKLQASAPWRSMLLEYRTGAPPATALGELDAEWRQG